MRRFRIGASPLLLLAGLAMLFFVTPLESYARPFISEVPWVARLYSDLALGLLISGILGMTIDRALKENFARDVFKATMGHLLPVELKSEVEFLYRQAIVCTRSRFFLKIEPCGENKVKIHLRMERTLKNFSGTVVNLDVLLITESILDATELYPVRVTKAGKSVDRSFERRNSSFLNSIRHDPITLGSEEEVVLSYEWSELKWNADSHHETWLAPTHQPEIYVDWPHSMDVQVHMNSHRKLILHWAECRKDTLVGKWALESPTTLLPYHGVVIRWKPLGPTFPRETVPSRPQHDKAARVSPSKGLKMIISRVVPTHDTRHVNHCSPHCTLEDSEIVP